MIDKNNNILLAMEKSEYNLKKCATKSFQAIRFNTISNDIRLEYARDVDRVIHSNSFTKYIDKTQVFEEKYDGISRRITHVQFVSRASKTIARALSLNEDLCEAISLAHDVGHAPFGHVGERILNKISIEKINQVFAHNLQGVRNLMYIENKGDGLNLTLQVLDGILCHNGEFVNKHYKPILKNKEQFLNEYNLGYNDSSLLKKLTPMTLEGCVVRISDIIGYIGKDIEDAIKLGVLKRNEIPDNIISVLGDSNVTIMNTIILDIINNSIDKDYIEMSDEIYEAVINLKKFNYEKIYNVSTSLEKIKYIENVFEFLFNTFLEDLLNLNYNSKIFKDYLNNMNESYLNNNSNERKVIDYIACMTDGYMEDTYKLMLGGK